MFPAYRDGLANERPQSSAAHLSGPKIGPLASADCRARRFRRLASQQLVARRLSLRAGKAPSTGLGDTNQRQDETAQDTTSGFRLVILSRLKSNPLSLSSSLRCLRGARRARELVFGARNRSELGPASQVRDYHARNQSFLSLRHFLSFGSLQSRLSDPALLDQRGPDPIGSDRMCDPKQVYCSQVPPIFILLAKPQPVRQVFINLTR